MTVLAAILAGAFLWAIGLAFAVALCQQATDPEEYDA